MQVEKSVKKDQSKRGRPLDLSRNKVILEATLDLLAQTGYDALTIEAVANYAKVGKATIYRRWSSKVDLVIDAASLINPNETLLERVDRSQGLREQLIQLICISFQHEQKVHQHALSAIGAAMAHNKELEEKLHIDINRRHQKAIKTIISPFLKEGHHLNTKDLELLSDLGPALFIYRSFGVHKPFNKEYIEQIIDKLMLPMLETVIK
ncbi:TetR/AcrR family transcriptional regulator [Halalkalibacter krulwichiae]|uniref:Bacterial regulatory proteins, tetR family n=1 Tax=Halalkalibacter krulwichiae TaxID=199441 RepID=A0A1X9MBT7_9BACI|nr:TetR/AcrR family transcriptional regulator [Halalkalibacter krulwichiae]ARK30876.1 Bacterial regulatory proteins, tetR family [Halalkalibacter krulwichiae]